LTSKSIHDDAKPVLASCLQLAVICAPADAPQTALREYYYTRIKNLEVSACNSHAFDYIGFPSLATMGLKNSSSTPFPCTFFHDPEFVLKTWTNDISHGHLRRILEGGIDDLLKLRSKEALIAKKNWISELVLDTSRTFKVMAETSTTCMRNVRGSALVDGEANVRFDIDTFSPVKRLTVCRHQSRQVTNVYWKTSVQTSTLHFGRHREAPKTEIMQWDRHHYEELGQESDMNDLELIPYQEWRASNPR
jgi:hypothetical protein